MGIKVTALNPVAGVSSSRPRVSVVVTEPVAGVSAQLLAVASSASVAGASVTAVIPVSRLSYIAIAASASLDKSGRFSYVPDVVYAQDAAVLQTSKFTADQIGFMDYKTISYDKRLADVVEMLETITRTLIFQRVFDETATVSEVKAISFARPVADAFGLSDRVSRGLNKARSSSVSTSDSSRRSTSKGLYDSATFLESLSRAVSKARADQIAVTDSAARSTEKVFADAFLFTDSVRSTVSRLIADGVAMNDTADLADGFTFQSSKTVSNVAFALDVANKSVASIKSDSASVASAGSLVSQGYCDPTYFAEDYVGDSRTFT